MPADDMLEAINSMAEHVCVHFYHRDNNAVEVQGRKMERDRDIGKALDLRLTI